MCQLFQESLPGHGLGEVVCGKINWRVCRTVMWLIYLPFKQLNLDYLTACNYILINLLICTIPPEVYGSASALAWAESSWTDHVRVLNVTWKIGGLNKCRVRRGEKLLIALWGTGHLWGVMWKVWGLWGSVSVLRTCTQPCCELHIKTEPSPLSITTWGWRNTQGSSPH